MINITLAPSIFGDPYTAFEVNFDEGYVVSGTAAGKVHNWRIDRVLKVIAENKNTDDTKSKEDTGLTSPTDNSTVIKNDKSETEYVGLEMCNFSDEGIRSIVLHKSEVYAMVGDVQVKHWSYCYDTNFTLRRVQRTHTASVCSMTSTLTHKKEALLLTTGSEDVFVVDVETCEDTTIHLPQTIPRCTPVFYDGSRLAWMETSESGVKTVRVFQITTVHAKTPEKTTAELEDERLNGPVLNAVLPNKDIEIRESKEIAKFQFPKTHKFYWGFQLSGDRIAHVCCQNKVKIWDLSNTKEPIYRIVAHKGARKIVAFHVSDQGKEVVTIGSDRKIKVWREGKLFHKYKNVNGQFRTGYPYVIKRVGTKILYTSDEGIHLLLIQ